MYAIVRDVPTTFDKCVTTVDNTVSPIDISLAKKQYEAYVNALREHVDHIVEIPADPLHPGKSLLLLLVCPGLNTA